MSQINHHKNFQYYLLIDMSQITMKIYSNIIIYHSACNDN